VVNLTLADVQFEIGALGLPEGSPAHALLHGLAGCAAAEATGASCAAGAAGGIAQSLYAGTTDETGRHLNAEEYTNTAEFIGALAGFLFSSGEAENVNVAALVAESGFENNALCGGVCIAALLAAGYVFLSGGGDPIEGVQTIGRGEDLLSELAAAGTEKGIAFASSHFPEETAAVIEAMVAAGEVANVAITYVDDATGNTISGTWNELPTGVQDAIKGGAIVATFVIPAGTVTKIRIDYKIGGKVFKSAPKASNAVKKSGLWKKAPNRRPRITIRDHYNHHNDMRNDVIGQLEGQGFKVSPGEASFGNSCGVGRCRPDIIYRTPDGQVRIIEIKIGNADLSIRQTDIFPQIENGNAIPRGNVARRFGLRPGVALKDQGYPNGIPIEIKNFPGAG
jgi:filamentous hemagglutinin